MDFITKTISGENWYISKKDGFVIAYTLKGKWYAVVIHTQKDIKFNSVWEGREFYTEKEIKQWCENFNYIEHRCEGKDFKKPL